MPRFSCCSRFSPASGPSAPPLKQLKSPLTRKPPQTLKPLKPALTLKPLQPLKPPLTAPGSYRSCR